MSEKKDERILLRMCRMSGNEMKYIQEAFADEWVVPLGPNVSGFERDLEEFLGEDKKVVALSSGTAAVHLALVLLGVGPGDEVMAQSFTFCASVNPVKYVGATPVFVDSEPHSWNMDADLLDKAIADRIEKTGKKPKAIIGVCLYGMPMNYEKILHVSAKWDIPFIEDAAEAFGSEYNGKRCGTFGEYGILSFNGNKMITTSGGGALVCPNEESARRALYFATQAREGYAYYQHEDLGYNYRMSNICAGIGRGQMTVLEQYLAHHRHRQEFYKEHLSGVAGITLHENPSNLYSSNFWLCTVLLDESLKVKGMENAYTEMIAGAVGGTAGVTKRGESIHTDCEPNANVEAMRLGLSENGIESRPLWKPMHLQPLYSDAPKYENGTSAYLFRKGLCLPAGPYVSDEDAERVVKTIKSLI